MSSGRGKAYFEIQRVYRIVLEIFFSISILVVSIGVIIVHVFGEGSASTQHVCLDQLKALKCAT